MTGVLRSLCRYRKKLALSTAVRAAVTREINYLLINARFCRSGMRWKRDSGALLLQLRAIKLSQQWEGFWATVMQGAT